MTFLYLNYLNYLNYTILCATNVQQTQQKYVVKINEHFKCFLYPLTF